MRQYLLGVLVVSFLLSPIFAIAQTNGTLIDYSGSTRDASAVLDVRSTNHGVLVPRLQLLHGVASLKQCLVGVKIVMN